MSTLDDHFLMMIASFSRAGLWRSGRPHRVLGGRNTSKPLWRCDANRVFLKFFFKKQRGAFYGKGVVRFCGDAARMFRRESGAPGIPEKIGGKSCGPPLPAFFFIGIITLEDRGPRRSRSGAAGERKTYKGRFISDHMRHAINHGLRWGFIFFFIPKTDLKRSRGHQDRGLGGSFATRPSTRNTTLRICYRRLDGSRRLPWVVFVGSNPHSLPHGRAVGEPSRPGDHALAAQEAQGK